MRILYVECSMGAAGDMLMGALYELCQEKERFLGDMNSLLPGVSVAAETVTRQSTAESTVEAPMVAAAVCAMVLTARTPAHRSHFVM